MLKQWRAMMSGVVLFAGWAVGGAAADDLPAAAGTHLSLAQSLDQKAPNPILDRASGTEVNAGAAPPTQASPAQAPPTQAPPAQASTPPAETRAARIAFVGDSMVDGIWGGFVRAVGADPCLKAAMEFGRYGRDGTGLARGDRFDWPAAMARIATSFHPDLVIVSLGLNDRQSLVNPGHVRTDATSPAYGEKYSIEVRHMLDAAGAGNVSVMWVGLPVLRDQAADADARAKNDLFRTALASYHQQPRIDYVDPWKLNPATGDDYAANGPGPDGSLVSLRASDGIHFTGAGYDLIAKYLYPKVLDRLDQQGFHIRQACPGG